MSLSDTVRRMFLGLDCTLGGVTRSLIALLFIFGLGIHCTQAQECGVLNLNGGNFTVIIGDYAVARGLDGENLAPPGINDRHLAACILGAGGFTPESPMEFPECIPSTPPDQNLKINLGSGNDRLLVLHGFDAAIRCSPEGRRGITTPLWLEGYVGYSFGITASMGAGADVAHGSPNDDRLCSNTCDALPRIPPTLEWFTPGDGSNDTPCGYGGTDLLLGDADDTTGPRPFTGECLNGGRGRPDDVDYCDARDSSNTPSKNLDEKVEDMRTLPPGEQRYLWGRFSSKPASYVESEKKAREIVGISPMIWRRLLVWETIPKWGLSFTKLLIGNCRRPIPSLSPEIFREPITNLKRPPQSDSLFSAPR